MNATEATLQLFADIATAGLSVASERAYEAQFDDCVDDHGGDVDAAYATCYGRIQNAAAKLKGPV